MSTNLRGIPKPIRDAINAARNDATIGDYATSAREEEKVHKRYAKALANLRAYLFSIHWPQPDKEKP